MEIETLLTRHADRLATRLSTTPATDLKTLRDQADQASIDAEQNSATPDGVARTYQMAAEYLAAHDQMPLTNRPDMLRHADIQLSDVLNATTPRPDGPCVMTKQEALLKASDAVQLMYITEATYGPKSTELDAATEATRGRFLLARDYGATDDDLQALNHSA